MSYTLKPALKPLAPVNRYFSLPESSVEKFIDRIVRSPKTLDWEIDDFDRYENGEKHSFIVLYFVENIGYHTPFQPSYRYTIQIA